MAEDRIGFQGHSIISHTLDEIGWRVTVEQYDDGKWTLHIKSGSLTLASFPFLEEEGVAIVEAMTIALNRFQCPFKAPMSDHETFLNCTLKAGHAGDHIDGYNQKNTEWIKDVKLSFGTSP